MLTSGWHLRPWLSLLVGLTAIAMGDVSGHAQTVLHEPVAAPSLRCRDGVCQADGARDSSLPEAVVGEDGMIGAPLSGRNPQEHEQIFTSANQSSPLTSELMRGAPPPGHDPPPVRRPRVTPDADTGPEAAGERLYHEVFNPAVFPYKRMSVLDAVDDSGALTVADRQRRELYPSGNRLSKGRDPFYGSLVVDFIANEPVSLPTPAAGIRLLSYKATPDLPLTFFTDGADNLFARASRSGRHRLIYLVDAEQRYFAGSITPSGPARRVIRLDALPAPAPLPRALRRDADKVLRHLGVRAAPSSDYLALLGRLVGYFRDFQIEELPPDTDEGRSSLYLRIALSQHGVCRHRAYAFVITALGAGIPARYVENELHVFVEVYIPSLGDQPGYWRRINLGGAPLQQRVVGGDSRVAYQEKGGDPFERPSSFSHGAPPRVAGLPRRMPAARDASGPGGLPALDGPEDRARRGARPNDGAPSGTGSGQGKDKDGAPGLGSDGTSGGSGSGSDGAGHGKGKASGPGDGIDAGGEVLKSIPPDSIEQPDDARPGAATDLAQTRVEVAIGAARHIYRGTAVPVHGRVLATHGSAANLEVILLLATPDRPLVLGRTLTRTDGGFETEVEIPAAAPLGNFQVVARVRGDDTRRGSSSGRYTRLGRAASGSQEFLENE